MSNSKKYRSCHFNLDDYLNNPPPALSEEGKKEWIKFINKFNEDINNPSKSEIVFNDYLENRKQYFAKSIETEVKRRKNLVLENAKKRSEELNTKLDESEKSVANFEIDVSVAKFTAIEENFAALQESIREAKVGILEAVNTLWTLKWPSTRREEKISKINETISKIRSAQKIDPEDFKKSVGDLSELVRTSTPTSSAIEKVRPWEKTLEDIAGGKLEMPEGELPPPPEFPPVVDNSFDPLKEFGKPPTLEVKKTTDENIPPAPAAPKAPPLPSDDNKQSAKEPTDLLGQIKEVKLRKAEKGERKKTDKEVDELHKIVDRRDDMGYEDEEEPSMNQDWSASQDDISHS